MMPRMGREREEPNQFSSYPADGHEAEETHWETSLHFIADPSSISPISQPGYIQRQACISAADGELCLQKPLVRQFTQSELYRGCKNLWRAPFCLSPPPPNLPGPATSQINPRCKGMAMCVAEVSHSQQHSGASSGKHKLGWEKTKWR